MLFALALIFLALSVWNEVDKQKDHHKFFAKVEAFMEAGGRNTAENGYRLCKRQGVIEAEHNIYHNGPIKEQKSCEEIYNIKELIQ